VPSFFDDCWHFLTMVKGLSRCDCFCQSGSLVSLNWRTNLYWSPQNIASQGYHSFLMAPEHILERNAVAFVYFICLSPFNPLLFQYLASFLRNIKLFLVRQVFLRSVSISLRLAMLLRNCVRVILEALTFCSS